MIDLASLRELYDYNSWARHRQLGACQKLTEEEFLRPMGSSFSSLRDTCVHLLGAEWIWLERFRGKSPQSVPAWLDQLRGQSSIAARWQVVELDLREYLDALKTSALTRPLTYLNLQGKQWTYPLWKALLGLVIHQSYHRGQVTTLLRQIGAKPVPVDYLVYFDSLREAEISQKPKPAVRRRSDLGA